MKTPLRGMVLVHIKFGCHRRTLKGKISSQCLSKSPVKKATVIIGVFKSPDKNWVLAVRLAKIFHCVYLRIGI